MTLLRNAKKKQFLMLTSLLTKSQYISKQAFLQISCGKKMKQSIYLIVSFFHSCTQMSFPAAVVAHLQGPLLRNLRNVGA